MAEVKSPRVNERGTRAERFITDCLDARKRASKRIFLPIRVYRKKGPYLVAPPPPLTIEAWGNGLSDTKTVGMCIGAKHVHRCVARPHSASLIGELRIAENGVFAVTKCIHSQGSVFWGSLLLQIMELTEEEP